MWTPCSMLENSFVRAVEYQVELCTSTVRVHTGRFAMTRRTKEDSHQVRVSCHGFLAPATVTVECEHVNATL